MQKLLIIGYTWPEPKTTGAGVRMMKLIDAFLNNNFQITFASAAEKTEYSEALNPLGIQEKSIKLNDSTFDEFAKTLSPNIVLFDRFYTEEQFGWRLAETCPDAIRVLDTEDVHFLRFAREEALRTKLPINYKNSTFAFREIASIYRCDLSLIISKAEMELLRKDFKIDNSLLHYLPFLPARPESETLPDFDQRQHFIFIGNFKHKPNVDAVVELKQSIWPMISKVLPVAELHCYGAYANEHIIQLHNPGERFFFNGWAEDASEVIKNARVMLAPLRFGAGLKRKLIDAMQNGMPFTTTTVGIEGITNSDDISNLIADEVSTFSEIAIQLFRDNHFWKKAQVTGFEVLQNNFLNHSFEKEFFQKLYEIKDNLNSHRSNNFSGTMLMHHTNQSTKYLSKWIEEKNKTKN